MNAALNGLDGVLQSWKPPLVVVLDHSDVWRSVKAESPNTIFVGRVAQPLEPNFNEPSLKPALAARDHCETVLPMADRMGKAYDFWQGVNEPVIQSRAAMQRFADFEVERARILDRHGFRAVVGSFGVGNPPQMAWWEQFLPALEAARQLNGALALHEYAWPTLDHEWPWYLLRHRKVYDGEPGHQWAGLPSHLKILPLLITECGLDGLIERSSPPRGWKSLYGQDPSRFLQQLAWYDAELRKDPYVVGAALYCCCTAEDPQWAPYNIWPEVAQVLAQQARPVYRLAQLRKAAIAAEPPMPRSPAEEPPAPAEKPDEPLPREEPKEQPEPAQPAEELPQPQPKEQPRLLPPPPQLPAVPEREGQVGRGGRRITPDGLTSAGPPIETESPVVAPPPAPLSGADMLEQVLERLDRIMELLQRRAKQA